MTYFDGGSRLSIRGRTRSRLALSCAAAALVVLGAACGGGGSSDDGNSSANTGGGGGGGTETTAAASQHFDTDLQQVCRGEGATWATAYDPATTGAHKVVVFEGADAANLNSVSTGNTDWDVLFDANSDAYAEVELVACAIRTGDEIAQTCTGYTDDSGNDTGQSVEYHSATYDVTVRSATTGEVLGQTTIEAAGDTCPMLVYFDDGEKTKVDYADVDANSFLLAYATT